MKNIKLVHRGTDYITISFDSGEYKNQEVEITQPAAILVIETLGKALKKKSFLNN